MPELQYRTSGNGNPHTLAALNNLAASYCGLGDLRKALELQKRVDAITREG